jgi:hypothetical protein
MQMMTLPRKRIAFLLVAALILAQGMLPGEENQSADKPAEETRLRRVLEKSLLFPGLGQLSEKQYAKAALFAGAEIACLVQVVVSARRGNDAYWSYRGARTVEDAVKWRAETERLDRRRNTAILAAAGVWVLNMADIFVHAKKKYGRKKSVAIHPFYHHESHAYGAGVTCRF